MAVISNCPAALFISHRHILDIYIENCTALRLKKAPVWRACFSPHPDRKSARIYHHFTHKSWRRRGSMKGGRDAIIEIDRTTTLQPRGGAQPSETITINRLNAMKRTAVWKWISTYRWWQLQSQGFQKWAAVWPRAPFPLSSGSVYRTVYKKTSLGSAGAYS